MKNFVFASLQFLFGVLLLGVSANASDMSSSSYATSLISDQQSLEKCQFSLTSYSGTISNEKTYGTTANFQVGLNCPQEKAITATVFVFIGNDKDPVVSKIVTIDAGNMYSQYVSIVVGKQYIGKNYRMTVQ